MKKIRLTENDLHRIVRESVKQVIRSINEEGEAAGATNASQSGPFTTPISPVSRRGIYDTTYKRTEDLGSMTTQHVDDEGTDVVNKRKK